MEGLIFGAICALWLIYLVPWFLSHRGQVPLETTMTPEEISSSTMTIVRTGDSLAVSQPGEATVSTPMTRRAVQREVRRIRRTAAVQRRRVLLGLLVMLIVTIVLAIVNVLQWTWVIAPAAMIIVFFVVSPVTVKVMKRRTDQLLADIDKTDNEETVVVKVVEVPPEEDTSSVSLDPPATKTGSLWDPIPVTAPTYMSQPLAARTVRTIDLSTPLAPPTYDVPVPQESATTDEEPEEGLRAYGA